jgi:hypothetical protein
MQIRSFKIVPANDSNETQADLGLLEIVFDSEAIPDDNVPAKNYEIKYYFSSNKDIFSQNNHKLDITFSYVDESGKMVNGSLKSDDDFVLFRQALPQRLENVNIRTVLHAFWYLDFTNVV